MRAPAIDIICLEQRVDDFGVYISGGYRGRFDTPLAFRGTEQECIDFAIGGRPVQCACGAGCTDGVCTAQELGVA